MTKYILNSGGAKNYPDKNKAFISEILKGLGGNPKMLMCLFASKREDWEMKFAAYSENLKTDLPDSIRPEIEMAVPDIFEKQVENADAIIIHGGDDYLLQCWLKNYDLPAIWKDKIVATSSAGSDALAASFWTCDWRRCMDGLGILPIKFIPHYNSDFGSEDPRGPIDWQKAYNELKDHGDTDLPIYALEEGDFIVFEQ